MNYKIKTLEELEERASLTTSKSAFVGFDGFVDRIVRAVDKRSGPGENFLGIETISDFGNRILGAAGKSTNIELYPRGEKIGGNGPILAEALLEAGLNVRYIGALGYPDPEPVFAQFASRSDAVSICDPGVTHAIEFDDGKIMLGSVTTFDTITYEKIVQVMGEGALFDALSRADLIALVNWTMLPHMTAIFRALLDRVFPNLGPRELGRSFFFDLADPEKRSEGDIRSALSTISRFRSHGQVTIGLNLKEVEAVSGILGHGTVDPRPQGLRKISTRIRRSLEISCVVVHTKNSAACSTREDSWCVEGPYTDRPLISTGAGDYFNMGFTTAQLLGLRPPSCLTVAVCASGIYVRTAKSPSLLDITMFLRNWE